jgi:hypothetical protein
MSPGGLGWVAMVFFACLPPIGISNRRGNKVTFPS